MEAERHEIHRTAGDAVQQPTTITATMTHNNDRNNNNDNNNNNSNNVNDKKASDVSSLLHIQNESLRTDNETLHKVIQELQDRQVEDYLEKARLQQRLDEIIIEQQQQQSKNVRREQELQEHRQLQEARASSQAAKTAESLRFEFQQKQARMENEMKHLQALVQDKEAEIRNLLEEVLSLRSFKIKVDGFTDNVEQSFHNFKQQIQDLTTALAAKDGELANVRNETGETALLSHNDHTINVQQKVTPTQWSNREAGRDNDECNNNPENGHDDDSGDSSPDKNKKPSYGIKQLTRKSTKPYTVSRATVTATTPTRKKIKTEATTTDASEQQPQQGQQQRQYTYPCFVVGCKKFIKFHSNHHPPLTTSNGNIVSDSVAWDSSFYTRVMEMRHHFVDMHPGVPMKEWPVAFFNIPQPPRDMEDVVLVDSDDDDEK